MVEGDTIIGRRYDFFSTKYCYAVDDRFEFFTYDIKKAKLFFYFDPDDTVKNRVREYNKKAFKKGRPTLTYFHKSEIEEE